MVICILALTLFGTHYYFAQTFFYPCFSQHLSKSILYFKYHNLMNVITLTLAFPNIQVFSCHRKILAG